jgi:hypothetical protein
VFNHDQEEGRWIATLSSVVCLFLIVYENIFVVVVE